MAEETLPSYNESISSDWLPLVAPYVQVPSYVALCLVCRKWYQEFAPRLWRDPLRTIRELGLDPSDDLDWYARFFYHRLRGGKDITTSPPWTTSRNSNSRATRGIPVCENTRRLVLSLDFRNFATDTCDFHSDTNERSITRSFSLYPATFPNLRCILLDGHADAEPVSLAQAHGHHGGDDYRGGGGPALLSLCQYPGELPPRFLDSNYLGQLVYLDLSHIPGSLRASVQQGYLSPARLPCLRILKVAGREMDDSTAKLLFQAFTTRLWSLDLSDNHLTDVSLEKLTRYCFAPEVAAGRRTESHFEMEGKLQLEVGKGTDVHGPFRFVVESERSATYDHPERFFADSPVYSQYSNDLSSFVGGMNSTRDNGLSPVKKDDSDAIKKHIFQEASSILSCSSPAILLPPPDTIPFGHCLTHLNISNNPGITSFALERLLLSHPGTIQSLSITSPLIFQPRLVPPPPSWPKTGRLSGIIGESYIFRPCISSSLRSLRIHHSLVTRVPQLSLPAAGLSKMATLWLAESELAPRVEKTFPLGWTPDMNPRLTSLTLTHIPRRSTGKVIDKICQFIHLAAEQEAMIQRLTTPKDGKRPVGVGGGKIPPVLRGLRVLRLEFDSEEMLDAAKSLGAGLTAGSSMDGLDGVIQDEYYSSTLRDEQQIYGLDPGSLLSLGKDDFCFFDDETRVSTSVTTYTTNISKNNTGTSPCSTPTASNNTGTGIPPRPQPPTSAPALPPRPQPSSPSSAPQIKLLTFPYAQPSSSPSSSEEEQDQYLQVTLPTYPPSPTSMSTTTLPVWIGTGILHLHSSRYALNEYQLRLQSSTNRVNPSPATPSMVAAGAQQGSYVFRGAWESMVYPPSPSPSSPSPSFSDRDAAGRMGGMKKPSPKDLREMKDVLQAVRLYRQTTTAKAKQEAAAIDAGVWEASTGGPRHYHWGGKIEVVFSRD